MKIAKSNSDKELTRNQIGRYEFWTQMKDYIDNSIHKLRTRTPDYNHWYDFSIGSSKYHLTVCLLDREKKIRVGLWISDDKNIFDILFDKKDQIESKIDFKLIWDRKDGSKSSSIDSYIDGFSFNDTAKYEEFNAEICRRLVLLEKTLRQYL